MDASARASTGVDPFVFSIRASARSRMLALALDAVIALTPFVAATVCAVTGDPASALLWMLVGAGIATGTGVVLARAGRSAGCLLTRIRVVERSSATPSGRRLLPDVRARAMVACDLRRGRDPLAPAVAGFRFPERTSEPTPSARAVTNAIALLDSGQRVPFARGLVIGRHPTPGTRSDQRFSWPDLSRTLARTHARLEWDGEHVWVSDLGSVNGSILQTGAERTRLEPFLAVRMPTDAVLWLGERSLTIAGTRRAARVAATGAADA
ncbi:FHA domain-containing protein [Microbacterium sp. 179-I 3D4 NHS]|uniref:FHA domain-containing protein n=1 Tax=Microbacterium sp. 179-I 3D4 NHS TaxID=3142381 RepID=UPI0039A33F08